ncbi:hypothetical protein K4B79_12300 [Streptomyces lincolnensis]|uniref:hypothetical protein n=1 Tax=Streptomyces lincolnensis TaxID=1915 RepID=UPI001E48475C|nr:hypothetical protein [Streptomyces lincolnensis]MCD7439006.1 hypothetical protein [Streptomyces lincolnensis]
MNTHVQSAVKAAAGTLLPHSAIYCLALGYDREEFRLMARKAEDKALPHMAKEYHQRADFAAALQHAVLWRFVEDDELIVTHWELLLGAVVRREAYELVEADRARKLLADNPDDEMYRDIWTWERDRADKNAATLAELKSKLTAVRDTVRAATA